MTVVKVPLVREVLEKSEKLSCFRVSITNADIIYFSLGMTGLVDCCYVLLTQIITEHGLKYKSFNIFWCRRCFLLI